MIRFLFLDNKAGVILYFRLSNKYIEKLKCSGLSTLIVRPGPVTLVAAEDLNYYKWGNNYISINITLNIEVIYNQING